MPNNEKIRQKTIAISKVLNTFAPEINDPARFLNES